MLWSPLASLNPPVRRDPLSHRSRSPSRVAGSFNVRDECGTDVGRPVLNSELEAVAKLRDQHEAVGVSKHGNVG